MCTHTIHCSLSQGLLLVELVEFPAMPLKATQHFPRAVTADASSTVSGTTDIQKSLLNGWIDGWTDVSRTYSH